MDNEVKRNKSYRDCSWKIGGHDIKDSNLMFRVDWDGYEDFSTLESKEFVLQKEDKVRDYLRSVKSGDFYLFDRIIKLAPELAEVFRKRTNPGANVGHGVIVRPEEVTIDTDSNEYDSEHGSVLFEFVDESPLSKAESDKTSTKRIQPIKRHVLEVLKNRCDERSTDYEDTLQKFLLRSDLICHEGGFRYSLVANDLSRCGGSIKFLGQEVWHQNKIEVIVQVIENFSVLYKLDEKSVIRMKVFEVKFEGVEQPDKLILSEVIKRDPAAVLRFLKTIKRKNSKRFTSWKRTGNVLYRLYTLEDWQACLEEIEAKEKAALEDYFEYIKTKEENPQQVLQRRATSTATFE